MANPTGLTSDELAREWSAAPPPDKEKPRVRVPGCVGCGQLHAGVTAGIHCLENTIRTLRAQLARKEG
jgi:hypothetical protein